MDVFQFQTKKSLQEASRRMVSTMFTFIPNKSVQDALSRSFSNIVRLRPKKRSRRLPASRAATFSQSDQIIGPGTFRKAVFKYFQARSKKSRNSKFRLWDNTRRVLLQASFLVAAPIFVYCRGCNNPFLLHICHRTWFERNCCTCALKNFDTKW